MKYALLSVFDKTGIVDFAQNLSLYGYKILSTGGTATTLREVGIDVIEVSDYTRFPEMMDGRVKTLHPKIHGGILGKREKHQSEAEVNGISWIDIVAVNLSPFQKIVTSAEKVSFDDALENIDIGGPTMLRAAAKNHKEILVLSDPKDYTEVILRLRTGNISKQFRFHLATKAFQHTSYYDAVISSWFEKFGRDNGAILEKFPKERTIALQLERSLRYGENPFQEAGFYIDPIDSERTLADVVVHQGKGLSFDNIANLDVAARLVFSLGESACVIVKHMNPCGAAVHSNLSQAFSLALSADRVSAFGGIVAFNRQIEKEDIQTIQKSQIFFAVIVAPSFSEQALEFSKERKDICVISLGETWSKKKQSSFDMRRVVGGYLLQEWDQEDDETEIWETVGIGMNAEQQKVVDFAWQLSKGIKSHAIVLAKAVDGGIVSNGIGVGQMSRIDSVELALLKAARTLENSVLASDSFFQKPEAVEKALNKGISCFIQPGGSITDQEVFDCVIAAKATMIITKTRHLRH